MTTDFKAVQAAVELISGGWRAQAVHTAAKLRLPDHIAAGVTTDAGLAAATGAREDGIRRLMRLLVAVGLFEGGPSAGYRNTPVSATLLDAPGSLRDMCLLYGEEFYTAWGHAAESISTVTSGFELAYGRPLYAHLDEHPGLADRFQRAMVAGNLFFDSVPEVFDFTGGKTIVDCGGGNGHLLSVILDAVPDARGTLLDREHVIPLARANLSRTIGLDRVELVGGDMFEAVPEGGDVYVFCRVLAGWHDDDAVAAFAHCRRAITDPSARLLVLDRMVVDEESSVLPALWDLHLLMTTGGRHRGVEEFTSLLDRAGWQVERAAALPMETTALVAAPRSGRVAAR
ncbi:acetylserotonin O-methyltransferase [Streptomyces marincola]|uniref:acetylserotonin O-methyltransferase n=1 Tax=Streptomyces marincola TaxID=2878388 RepID=UPI001CF209A3|nr:acetylserotonin O-methyltransferase [Streptomyces marincola]UCM91526.1 acetylserotonin O-methyltransferase [Streptomyces marincola]